MLKITRLEILSVKQETVTHNYLNWEVLIYELLIITQDWLLRFERMLKNIQGVHSKGNRSWLFIVRSDVEAETPIFWPSDVKSWLIWKDPDVGKDWGQEEKGTIEDEMAGWHHRLNGHESGWTPGVGDGQGGLACCNSWGRKESDTTERLIWSDLTVANILLSTSYMPGTVVFKILIC